MNDVRFDAPAALALLGAVIALVALDVWRGRRARGGLLFSSLAIVPAAAGARTWLRAALVPMRVLALVLLVLGLARPQIGHARVEVTTEGIDIAVVLDTSSSMREEDFDGRSRMDASKDVVREFIRGLRNDRVAVVLFSAESVVLAPLTTDYAAAEQLVVPVEEGVLPDGTAIGTGMATGINVLRESQARSKVVILLTDGQNNSGQIGPLDAANIARLLGQRVYVIGAVGGVERGRRFIGVDEQLMQRISEMTGGRYYRASDPEGLRNVYDQIGRLEKSEIRRAHTDYEDVHLPLLAPAVALVVLELLLGATLLRRIP